MKLGRQVLLTSLMPWDQIRVAQQLDSFLVSDVVLTIRASIHTSTLTMAEIIQPLSSWEWDAA